jgi:hypothetical protein
VATCSGERIMPLSKLELDHLLALLISYRSTMREKQFTLREKLRAGYDGPVNESLRVVDAEIELLTGIIRKLSFETLP